MSELDDRAADEAAQGEAARREGAVGSALLKAKHDLNNLFHVARGWSRLLQDPRSGFEQTQEGIAAVLAAAEQTSELVNGVLALGSNIATGESSCLLAQDLALLARGLRYLCAQPARFELQIESRVRVRCNFAELRRELVEGVLAAQGTLAENALRLRLTEEPSGSAELTLVRVSSTKEISVLRSWHFVHEQGSTSLGREASASSGARAILLVDDHRDVRRLATTLLERSGYLVLTAADAEEARVTSDNYEGVIDLLCCAAALPGRSALDLIAELESARPALKILVLSDEPPRGKLGELPQLAKPFSYQQLIDAVRACLA